MCLSTRNLSIYLYRDKPLHSLSSVTVWHSAPFSTPFFKCPLLPKAGLLVAGLELPRLDPRGTWYLVITPLPLRCLELPQLEQHAVEHAVDLLQRPCWGDLAQVLAPEARGLTGVVAR